MEKRNWEHLKVDLDHVICDNFLGLNAVYHGFNYMPEQIKRGMTDADRQQEYSRVRDCRLKIARTMFLPSYNCRCITGPYYMESERMSAIVKWCRDMQQMNVDIALQAGWFFPQDSHYGVEKPDGDSNPEAYAGWIAATIKYLTSDCGLTNIKYLFLFTEPGFSNTALPEGYTGWTYYVRLCKAVDLKFRQIGLRDSLQFVGPNNSASGMFLDEAVRDLNDVLDIYTGHDYNFAKYEQWQFMSEKMYRVIAPTGKPFWLDEYGTQLEILRVTPQCGNYFAQIIAASVCAGHQTSLTWMFLDQLYPGGTPPGVLEPENNSKGFYNNDSFHNGIHRCGLCSWPHDTVPNAGSPYPVWYAYKLMAIALGGKPGCGKVSSLSFSPIITLYGAAVKQNNDYTFMIVNSNAENTVFSLQMSHQLCKPLYKTVFDPYAGACYGTDAAVVKILIDHDILTDELPASGFAIYSTYDIL